MKEPEPAAIGASVALGVENAAVNRQAQFRYRVQTVGICFEDRAILRGGVRKLECEARRKRGQFFPKCNAIDYNQVWAKETRTILDDMHNVALRHSEHAFAFRFP